MFSSNTNVLISVLNKLFQPPVLYADSWNYVDLFNETTLTFPGSESKITDFKDLHTVYQIRAVTFLKT